ncbi:MAG: cytochrome C oxidase subunit IV family protein [Pseudobdellovibrionaceae bacterium]
MANKNTQNDPNVLHPHITPMATYLKVAGALFALTFLTVIAHQFHVELGAAAAPIAFLIATVKAVLVMMWFMHLKDDTNINRVIFGAGFFFLAVLILFTVLDMATRVVESSPL